MYLVCIYVSVYQGEPLIYWSICAGHLHIFLPIMCKKWSPRAILCWNSNSSWRGAKEKAEQREEGDLNVVARKIIAS